FAQVTPLVEPISLDEAFLDVSGVAPTPRQAVALGHQLRDAVADEQMITCSVGIAPVKFVAKLASTRAKPDGLLLVERHETLDFLHPLPVEALWGVGETTKEKLHRLGLRTVGDVAHLPERTLVRALGQSAGVTLHRLAWGHDERRVVPH
ncbi:DNA polymerase IV, partial [Myxococcus xanthus]|nr:DNA polymerase IV [Myxococcus xanthus]